MKKLMLLGCFMLALVMNTNIAAAAWQPELKVLLTTTNTVSLTLNQPAIVRDLTNNKTIAKVATSKAVKFMLVNGKLFYNDKQVANQVEIVPADLTKLAATVTQVNQQAYRGAIMLAVQNDNIKVINRVTTEDYLKGVIPQEMPTDWNSEALKAQAVAARTFALHSRKRHDKAGYDICNTTHCQVYTGVAGEKTTATNAITVTAGEVLTYQNNLIDALFHTDSGGMTESSLAVWGTNIHYLQPATEVKDMTQPWEKTLTAESLTTILAKQGKTIGNLNKITLTPLNIGKATSDRSLSGRVKTVKLTGQKGSCVVTGQELRQWLSLKSTLFNMTLRNNVVFINGFGWGHGIGMSQWGAKAWADNKHYDYKQILAHYYQGTTLKKLY